MGANSSFPNTFEFRTIPTDQGDRGYLRIRTFGDPGPQAFINEVVRILELLPQDGVIVDVRGNGGGIIMSGERMLQFFSPNRVKLPSSRPVNMISAAIS